jgi:death on curing protein
MEEIEYPAEAEVLAIHADIIDSDPAAAPGTERLGAIESALVYVSEGYFGQVPETIHQKAAHLLRLIAAGHIFVDGNKRTALDTVALFYLMNGYEFTYDEELEDEILVAYATDQESVDIERVIAYCREHTEQ